MIAQPKSLRVAVATAGDKGLMDTVSHEFGHANTFTIVAIQGSQFKGVETIQNPAASLSHGRGLVVAKHLADTKVKIVISGEVGLGALAILNEIKIKTITVKHGQRVINVLRDNSLVR